MKKLIVLLLILVAVSFSAGYLSKSLEATSLNGAYPEVYQTGWEVGGVSKDIQKLYHTENLTLTEFNTIQDYKNYVWHTGIPNNLAYSDCDKAAFALTERALNDGMPIGLAIWFIQDPATKEITIAHCTNVVFVGNNAYQTDARCGSISNWNGWRITRD